MKISIITATNKPIMERTVLSVKNQTNKNFEWIVVDDGYIIPSSIMDSFFSDGTVNHVMDTVKFIHTADNYGASVARNIGFQIADGEIITYLDADDELNPGRIQHLIDIFTNYPAIQLLFSGYEIEERGGKMFFDHFNFFKGDAHQHIKLLEKQNISIPMGVAHTRIPFVLNGGFQRGIVCGEDGILWRRMYGSLPTDSSMFDNSCAGIYHVNENGQSRKQPRPKMGGFAFDGSKNDNGKYLDQNWFATFNSKGLYDGMDSNSDNSDISHS